MKKMYKKGGSLKGVPSNNKGLAKLPKEVRNKMGYMKQGGEKLLSKMMRMGGPIDMSEQAEMTMRYGGQTKKMMYGGKVKKAFGGTTGRRTYSGKKKK